ncbi:hypothetical protein ILUMI_12333 [Ignelater luminosus]|uniref:TIL domain-containing protein n=1 Tax=Ignelater luminosus TaxID=2038154 RepID=A0A8K0D322_IGNLU|nr:hypothetical protein ILUMI_12333 [Ignelater luminosus]
MRSLYVFVFFCLFAAALGGNCPGNEVYSDCQVPVSCRLTCENYKNPPTICPAVCVSGCACPSGLVQKAAGNCVPSNQC